MTARTLPVALAHWMSNRLAETLDRPLDEHRTYALTVVDPADLDPCAMHVRANVVLPADRRRGSHERPDALAAASRLWLVPDGALGGPSARPSRPNEFPRRRAALAIAVVADAGAGVVIRFEDDPDEITVVDPKRAAGLLLPVVMQWQAYEDEHA